MRKPWASGLILIVCVIIAMLLANLPFTHQLYHDVLNTKLSMSIQSPTLADGTHFIDWLFPKDMTVEKFINDILMVISSSPLDLKSSVRSYAENSPHPRKPCCLLLRLQAE